MRFILCYVLLCVWPLAMLFMVYSYIVLSVG